MTSVFVLTEIVHREVLGVIGVFSTEAAAEVCRNDNSYPAYIEEWEIDGDRIGEAR